MPDNPTQPITGAEDKGPRGAVPPNTPEPRSFDPGKTGGRKAEPHPDNEPPHPGAPAPSLSGASHEGSDPAGASASGADEGDTEAYPRAATISDEHAQLGLAGSEQGRQRDRPPISADDAGATAMAEAAAARKGQDVVDPMPPDAAKDVE